MQSYFRRFTGWTFGVLMALWAVIPKLLDWVGRSTLPDDWRQLMDERLPEWAGWLFSTPSWVPGALAIAAFAWMIWITAPRPTVEKPPKLARVDAALDRGGRDQPLPLVIVSDEKFAGKQVTLDRKHFIRCNFEGATINYNGGEFRVDGCNVPPGKYTFGSTNPVVIRTMQIMGALGWAPEDSSLTVFEIPKDGLINND